MAHGVVLTESPPKFEGNFGQLELLKFKKITEPMGVES